MILKERFILGALIVVALSPTLSYGTPIATTIIPLPIDQSSESANETRTTISAKATEDHEEKEADSLRMENARSLDFDISKYMSRDFHNKVYDLQMPPENEKLLHHEISKVHTTFRTSALSHNAKAYDNYDLSTPNTRQFDIRHRIIQNEIQKRLEVERNVDEEVPEPEEAQKDEPLERNSKTVVDIVRYSNVLTDKDVHNKTSISRNYETEKGLNLSYENSFNEREVIGAKEKLNNVTEEGRRKSSSILEDEQTQQENNIAPVLLPLSVSTMSNRITSMEASSTRMYELTDQDYVSTTEFPYDEVSIPDSFTERFYEMTEHTTTHESAEVDAVTTVNVVNGSKLEQVAGNAVTDGAQRAELVPITTPIDANTMSEVTSTTIIIETSTMPSTTPPNTETAIPDVGITTETETFSTLTEQSPFASTTDASEITTLTLPIHIPSTSTTPGSIYQSITVQESTTNAPETTTAIPDVVATTIALPMSDSNAIIKDEEVLGPGAPAAGPNEIRKYNVSVPDDFDDITDEATDDYIDVHRKHKNLLPIIPKQPSQPITEMATYQTTHTATPRPDADRISDKETHGLSEDAIDAITDSDKTNNSGTIIAIALSTVGAICLILLAILLFVMQRRQKRFNYGQRCTPVSLDAYSMDNVSVYNSVRRKPAVRSSKRSYGNPAFDDDTTVAHPLNFQAIIRFANNTEEIRAEFEQIPQVTAKMSELPDGCDMKNRYANVIPLPESRVFLTLHDDDPTSDYINANYVTGPKRTRGYYIACQAPLHNTVSDFWRMIWEQQSRVILMLTHLYENGVEKCVDYLPPSEVVDCHRLFGDFQVTLKKREVKDKYIIASLQLKNMVSNSWREVTHLWYSGWPEKGVPMEANSIIAFLIEARSYIKVVQNVESKENGTASSTSLNARGNQAECSPVVVHCSPGTGRTGTVIACDIAIREFELRRVVDVPRIVYRIRRDRASSVQTKDQYHFIYKVISLYATKLTGGALDSI